MQEIHVQNSDRCCLQAEPTEPDSSHGGAGDADSSAAGGADTAQKRENDLKSKAQNVTALVRAYAGYKWS